MSDISTFTDKIFRYFTNYPDVTTDVSIGNNTFRISDLSENKKLVIETIKLMIDTGWDVQHGFQMEFNDSYTKVKKIEIDGYKAR